MCDVSSQCNNAGSSCVLINNRPSCNCSCPNLYNGTTCEICKLEITLNFHFAILILLKQFLIFNQVNDPCLINPCLNGGICYTSLSTCGAMCRCLPEFTGPLCSQSIEIKFFLI